MIQSSIFSGDDWPVAESISAKNILALICEAKFADATKFIAGIIIVSFSFKFIDKNAKCNAAVPLLQEYTYGTFNFWKFLFQII